MASEDIPQTGRKHFTIFIFSARVLFAPSARMGSKKEKKTLAWPSSMLGCIPSSKDAASTKMSISRHPHESDDDDHAPDDTIIADPQMLEKLSQQIDNFLYHAGSQGDWSGSLGTIATGINISSRGLDSMSHGFSKAYEKLKSTKFENMMNTAGEIFAVMGKVHWAASGLLVVAAVINNIERKERVNKECIELLSLVNTVAKSLRKLTRSAHIPEEMETTINQAINIISRSVACCFYIIESHGIFKYICSSKNASDISACKKELKNMQRTLVYQLVIADFTERHESYHRPHHRPTEQQGQYKYKPEEDIGSELSTTNSPRGVIGNCLRKLHICNQADSSDAIDQESEIDENQKPDEIIRNLLVRHQTDDERAVAIILYGDRQTGIKTVAKDVWRKKEEELKEQWKLVQIEADRGQGGLVEDDGLVFDLRTEIIRQLELENIKAPKSEKESSISVSNIEGSGESSKSQRAMRQPGSAREQLPEKDKDWERKLRGHLKAARKVFIFIPKVPSAGILKRILPRSIAEGVKIRVLLVINDKSVFSALEDSVFKTHLYLMKPLRYREALGVFREILVLNKSRELVVRKIIKICKGYRKRMETVREYLSNYYIADDEAFERLSEWIEAKEPNFTEMMDYLTCEKVFLHLSPMAQDALLDICSFFNNWGWHETACIIDSDVLEMLKERELVKRESNKVSVPLPVMTYCLSRAKGIRITRATDLQEILTVEKEPGKLKFIQGIWMAENKFPFHIDSSELDKMENLRVLALGDWTIVRGDCNKSFRHLRYFQAGKLERLPFKMDKADNLRFFDNNSNHYFGSGEKEPPPNLRLVKSKGMKLEQYLDFSSVPDGCELTDLSLEGFDHDQLPETLCDVYFMQNIFLRQCKKLKKLPKNFGKLQCLKTLDLSHCEALYELSPNFGWLICLEKANFSYCKELKCLPESFGLLRSVKELDFSYCKSLEELPKSFAKLATLQVLNLRGCSHLLALPEGFDGLVLKELHLESCKRLKALHAIVVAAESLTQTRVSLSWCKSLAVLSKGFISVIKSQVVELILVDCLSLQMLPENFSTELSNIKVLNLSGCKSLSRLPKRLSKLKYLQSLNLESCERLEESSIKFRHLSSLQELNLSNCHGLAGDCLGSLIAIKGLTFLDIHGSPMLVDRWNLLNRDRRISHLVVTTGLPGLGSLHFSKSLKKDPHIRKELRRGIYEFFNGKWIFLNLDGRQLHPSGLQEGSTLAVLFYHDYQEPEIKALRRILDDLQLTCDRLQIVHVGTCVTDLEKKLAGNHVVYGCDNYGALVFFERALFTVEGFDQSMNYAMIISDVACIDKHKIFASWTAVTYQSVREMTQEMDFQITNYLYVKNLIEDDNPQERSVIKLLDQLLLTKEVKFLISKTGQVELKELEGKCVFLLLSWLHNMETEYNAFNNVYQRLKILLPNKFEVVWIPVVVQGRGTRTGHAEWVEKVEWLSIADPWSINPMLMRYFRRHASFDKLPLLAAVSPDGRFYFDSFVLNTKIEEEKLTILLIREDKKRITQLVQIKVKEVLMKLAEESKLVEEKVGKQEVEMNVREERKRRAEMERKIREQLREGNQWREEMEIKIRDMVLMNLTEENKSADKTARKEKEEMKDREKKKKIDKQEKERTKVDRHMWEEMKLKIKNNVIKEIEIKIEKSVIKEGKMIDEVEKTLIEEVKRKFRKELESSDIENMFKFEDELVAKKIEWWWTKEVNKKSNVVGKKGINAKKIKNLQKK